MSIDLKALRALLDAERAAIERVDGQDGPRMREWSDADDALRDALIEAGPVLIALAEAAQGLAPILRQLDATMPVYPTASAQALARRVLAILEGK